jgi:hypothetical protein
LADDTNIPEMNLDSRPYIQEAMEDAIDHIVEYNLNRTMGEEYWLTYKEKLFRDIQKIYYRADIAFYNVRKEKNGDNDINRLLNEIDAWITKLSRHEGTKIAVDEMDKGKTFLFRLRPYLMVKELYKVAEGVTVDI